MREQEVYYEHPGTTAVAALICGAVAIGMIAIASALIPIFELAASISGTTKKERPS